MLKLETIRISPELKSMISVFYLKMAPQYEKPASKPKPYNINIEAVGGSSRYGKSQTPSKLSCLSVRRSDLRIMLISNCSKIVQQRDLSTARAKTSNILLIFLNYAQATFSHLGTIMSLSVANVKKKFTNFLQNDKK